MRKLASLLLLLSSIAALPAAAQSWDTSGNGLLKGSYYFRHVIWYVGDSSGNLEEAWSIYGNITFDGNGNYSISGAAIMDSANSAPQNNFSASGTYAIAASGYGSLSSPFNKGDFVYGLVSNGIFVASSADNGNYNDIFIAAQLPSTTPTNSFFNGTYSMMSMDLPAPYPISSNSIFYTRASQFQLQPNGNGSIGGVQLTGYIAGNGTNNTTQNISSVNYRFSNGAAVVSFGGTLSASSNLIAGDKYLYFSPDGNFVFGGSPNGWDMIVGVKATSNGPAPKFSGLYYQAFAGQDNSALSSNGYVDLLTGYGAVNSLSGRYLLEDQQTLDVFNGSLVDYTYGDSATANSDGTFSDSYYNYIFTAGGALGIGFAQPPSSLGLAVLVQAPTFSGQGVYINPAQVQNAGTNVPFTAQFAPGELISIYGTNLATGKAGPDGSLPTSLGGVQVMINNQPAPIHFVSPGQINAVVPINITTSIASIQVVNSIGSSNIVTNYVGLTQPGIFNSYTDTPAVQHADYSMVTKSSPAQVGETLQVYLTGLGDLNVSGNATNSFTAYFDNSVPAQITFAGSQSSIGGGYQMNLVVPSGIHSGYVYLDISGPDTYSSVAVLPIASGSGTVSSIRTASRMRAPKLGAQRPKPRRRQ